ncbi:MAG TPA: hypothetical protein VE988_17090 [Gemmataceae bacterium]|nr:hypothetical protein [Gemmataceae bacterium]
MGKICLFAVLSLLTTSGSVKAQPNDAEKLFLGFEKKLADAKTYKVGFDIEMTDRGETMKLKGNLLLTTGNQMRLSFSGSQSGPGKDAEQVSGTLVSDGRQVGMSFGPDGKAISKTEAAADQLTAQIKGFMTKAGLFIGVENANRAKADKGPEKLQLTGFKMGGKEKVGNAETQIIEYTLAMPGDKETITCKLWLDTKTNLPAKRTLEGNKGGQIARVVEMYNDWQIDPKLKGDEFTLPK